MHRSLKKVALVVPLPFMPRAMPFRACSNLFSENRGRAYDKAYFSLEAFQLAWYF
jgi:hypothetical protein